MARFLRLVYGKPAGALAAVIAAAALSAPALAQENGAKATGEKLFSGACGDDAVIAGGMSPRDRIMSASGKDVVDPITQRVFQGFSLEEAAAVGGDEFDDACWSRIDGVWREQMRVTFDETVEPGGWTSENPSLRSLAHGDYTTPGFLVIRLYENPQHYVYVSFVGGDGIETQFTSADPTPLEEILKDPSRSKTYWGAPTPGDIPLTIKATHSGFIRITLDGKDYYRPRPEVARVAREDGVASDDLFAIAYNPKNLRASRQGYDVTTQDSDQFLNNGGRLDIFAPSSARNYYVAEQMTVPMDLTLVPEGLQGMVYYSTLVSSEAEAQKSVASSFGASASVAAGGADVAIGYGEAQSEMNEVKASQSVSTINAYQRYKRYALVRDLPFSELSAAFIDVVMEARDDKNYARLIEKFGTHYPYATTYGAAGKLTTFISEQSLTNNYESFKQKDGSESIGVGSATVSGNISQSVSARQGNTAATSYGRTVFTAVGGNGSWDEKGFVAGDTPYPILMDLRPIDELLNEINFPNDEEIYTRVRAELHDAIVNYMSAKAAGISRVSLLDNFQPTETWAITAINIACYNTGSDENDSNVELSGILNYDTRSNAGGVSAPSFRRILDYSMEAPLKIDCNSGAHHIGNTVEISGTREQLRGFIAGFSANMLELDYAGVLNPDDTVKGSSGPIAIPVGAAVGGGVDLVFWEIPFSAGGKIGLHFSVKRVR